MKKIDIRDIANIKDMPAKEIAQIRSMVDLIVENTKKLQDLRRKNNCEKNLNARASVSFLINSLQSELKKKYNKFLVVTVIDEKLRTIAKKAPAKVEKKAELKAKKIKMERILDADTKRANSAKVEKKAPAKKAAKKVTPAKKAPAKKVSRPYFLKPDTMSEKTMKRLGIDPVKRVADRIAVAKIEYQENVEAQKNHKIEKMQEFEQAFSICSKTAKKSNAVAFFAFLGNAVAKLEAFKPYLKKIEIRREEKRLQQLIDIIAV